MRRIIAALSLLLPIFTLAQEKAIKPLDVPMSFSGNYGELRHNHFHQGMDWRVGGKVGDPIHSIKSGYVSRMSVSVTGYGNALYIDHPDGTTSVYGHMMEFVPELAARARKEQYANESFAINVTFGPEEYPVKQGDIIGKVGNTGSSGGPHLHMEVRDTDSETPLNYLLHGYYQVKDNMKPVFRRIAFYALDSLRIPDVHRIRMISSPSSFTGTVLLPRTSYVAVDSYDVQDGTNGKLAVEDYRMLLDGEEFFHFKVGDVGFDESPYIKSVVQAGESGADLLKSRVDPASLLNDRLSAVNEGLILLDDYDTHILQIESTDGWGNRAVLKTRIQRSDDIALERYGKGGVSVPCLWYMPNTVETEGFIFMLPFGTLYNNLNVYCEKVADRDTSSGIYSDVWKISSPYNTLASTGFLYFKAEVPESLAGKSYIASYHNGRLSFAGEEVGFGTYCLAVDNVAPVVTVDKYGRIRVRDDASGVASVDLFVDGEWHLAQYKGTNLTILDKNSVKRGQHSITIKARDHCGNETVYECKIAL